MVLCTVWDYEAQNYQFSNNFKNENEYMNYTEEDVRNAFKAGLAKGNHKSYFDAPLDEDEYLTELKQVKNNIVLADVSGRSEQVGCDNCADWKQGNDPDKYCLVCNRLVEL